MSSHKIYTGNKFNYTKLKSMDALNGGADKKKHNNQNLVIHISGPLDSGTTTLGNKLRKKYGNQVVVQDIDDFKQDYITFKCTGNPDNWDDSAFQTYIDQYVAKNKKPLVFVGLSIVPWDKPGHEVYYDMNSDYNFYIDIDDMEVVKQKCVRYITEQLPHQIQDESILSEITNVDQNQGAVDIISVMIDDHCGKKRTLAMNKICNTKYKELGYKFMSWYKIFVTVSEILDKELTKK